MRRVERRCPARSSADSAVSPSGERHVAIPEQSVVDQQEGGGRGRRSNAVDRRLRGVDRRHDAPTRPRFSTCSPLTRVPLVGHLADAQVLVEVGDDSASGTRQTCSRLFTTEDRGRRQGWGRPRCLHDRRRGAAISVPAVIESAAARPALSAPSGDAGCRGRGSVRSARPRSARPNASTSRLEVALLHLPGHREKGPRQIDHRAPDHALRRERRLVRVGAEHVDPPVSPSPPGSAEAPPHRHCDGTCPPRPDQGQRRLRPGRSVVEAVEVDLAGPDLGFTAWRRSPSPRTPP